MMGRLDSGSDYLMVDLEVWGEMDGELIQVLIAYVGILGKIQVADSRIPHLFIFGIPICE